MRPFDRYADAAKDLILTLGTTKLDDPESLRRLALVSRRHADAAEMLAAEAEKGRPS